MEYNLNNNNEQESRIIREKKTSSSGIYVIIALLLLVLIGWYGYTAGWFGMRDTANQNEAIPTEPNNGIGDGATPLNAAPIDSVSIESSEGFPVKETLIVKGSLPNGCTYLNEPQQLRDGNVFYITLDTRVEGDVCTEALVPYEKSIDLPVNNLPAGVYIVNINGRELSFELENDNQIDFDAGSDK